MVVSVPFVDSRCPWCGDDPLYVRYHDEEWGVPLHDERQLFEFLVLEGAQAGLSWLTVLRKRENYRRAFADFSLEAVAAFDERKVEGLMQDAGLIRNRSKLISAVANARACLKIRQQHGGLDGFFWQFVGGQPLQYRRRSLGEVPAQTEESRRMSRALRQAGMNFVGPTICYALMQAVGMVNDHLMHCPRWHALGGR